MSAPAGSPAVIINDAYMDLTTVTNPMYETADATVGLILQLKTYTRFQRQGSTVITNDAYVSMPVWVLRVAAVRLILHKSEHKDLTTSEGFEGVRH